MLIASALNTLTRRTTVQTFIEVHEPGVHALWMTDKATPQQLNLLLRPIQGRLREVRIERDAAQVFDPLEQLAQLGALRESGVVNDASSQPRSPATWLG